MKRRRAFYWTDLLVTSGLAATIAAASGYLTETQRKAAEERAKRCELAGAFLQDETLSPYLDRATARRLVDDAGARLHRCLKDG